MSASGQSRPTETLTTLAGLTLARRPDFAAFSMEWLGPALRIGTTPEHGTQEQINGSK
jgi:hypothetical protein